MHYEIRRQSDGPAYELVITFPDGRQEIEQYDDPTAVTRRSFRLERALTDAGWEPPPRRLSRPHQRLIILPRPAWRRRAGE